MKRIALTIIAVLVGVMNISAQQVDSLQTNPIESRIDSLETKLKTLQQKHDFLDCKTQLEYRQHSLKLFDHDIQFRIRSIEDEIHRRNFDRNLYNTHKENYDVYCSYLEALKEAVTSLQTLVVVTMYASNFSDADKDILTQSISIIYKHLLPKIEHSLNYYGTVLDIYKGSNNS